MKKDSFVRLFLLLFSLLLLNVGCTTEDEPIMPPHSTEAEDLYVTIRSRVQNVITSDSTKLALHRGMKYRVLRGEYLGPFMALEMPTGEKVAISEHGILYMDEYAKTSIMMRIADWIAVNFLDYTSQKTWLWASVALLLLMTIATFFMVDSDRVYHPVLLYLICAAFAVLCYCELNYFLAYNGDVTWFCDPDKVGWLYTIGGFAAMTIGLALQFRLLIFVMLCLSALGDRGDDVFSFLIGWVPVFIAPPLAWLLGDFFHNAWSFAFKAMLFMQVVQMAVIIFVCVKSRSSILNMVMSVFVSAISFIATWVMLYDYCQLLLVAIVILFIVAAPIIGMSHPLKNSSSHSIDKRSPFIEKRGTCQNCSFWISERRSCRLYGGTHDENDGCKSCTYG